MNRRETLKRLSACTVALASPLLAFDNKNMLRRKIPSTGEALSSVGLGTWQTFDVGSSESERGPLKEVLKALFENDGQVIDSSPMYGSSEKVVGDLSTDLKLNEKFFMATKVWTSGLDAGKKQIQNSFRLLQRDKIELLQIHNLVDWKTHLKTLQQMKEENKIKYIGLTHYLDSAHSTIETIIKENKIDFIQVNYSLRSRNAEKNLLPAAADQGVAVLINRPFEEGALFDAVKGKTLPAWAEEFGCKSWGQFFLKFILSNPHVTCVIPGTSKVKHLLDNVGAGLGRLPDENERKKMIALLDRG